MTISPTDTPKRLSDAELAGIAADLKAADGWPWNYEQRGQMVMGHSVGGCTLTPSDYRVADVRGWGHLQYLGVERGDGKAQALQDANGKLIAKAPEHISALLSHIAAITAPPSQGKVERARELLAKVMGMESKFLMKGDQIPISKAIAAITQALTESFGQGTDGTCCEAMREAILSIIPGGDICDPQQIADAIRALPLPVSADGRDDAAIELLREVLEEVNDADRAVSSTTRIKLREFLKSKQPSDTGGEK